MIKILFTIYRNTPYKYRKILANLAKIFGILLNLVISRFRLFGYSFYLDFTDNASYKYYTDRENYEKLLSDFFISLVLHNPRCYVVDVGANYGFYTLTAAQFGRFNIIKKVFAFEPFPKAALALRKSVMRNGFEKFVEVNDVIVGDVSGKAKIILSPLSSASNRSYSSNSEHSFQFNKELTVDSITLDEYLPRHMNIDESTFIIKIDVEGNELRVLYGMTNILKRCKGFAILFEHYPVGIKAVGLDPSKIIEYLESLGIEYSFTNKEGHGITAQSLEKVIGIIDEMNKSDNPMDADNFIIARGIKIPQLD